MSGDNVKVYQFKIELKEIKPKIWRRFQVPSNINFHDLHNIIQSSMGWLNYHLHQFVIKDPKTNKKVLITPEHNELIDSIEQVNETVEISKYFLNQKDKCIYEYDFGDGWEHILILEKILSYDPTEKCLPKLIAGKRACPPEDCGGYEGYYELLDIIKNPNHPEYKERMEWLEMIGRDNYDPEKFDITEISFDFDDPCIVS